jgi:hypothetical protein
MKSISFTARLLAAIFLLGYLLFISGSPLLQHVAIYVMGASAWFIAVVAVYLVGNILYGFGRLYEAGGIRYIKLGAYYIARGIIYKIGGTQ